MTTLDWFDAVKGSVLQVRSGRGGGSAFVLTTGAGASLLLTNHHVVSDQHTVTVTATDARRENAEVIASAPELDLALLSTTLPLPHLPSCPARPVLGEAVFALGHPWGRPWTLTRGVVSGLGFVNLGPDRAGEFIRSDVQLAPGNSGGPLLNARGEVLGVNSMVWAGGLGVAVPIWIAQAWADTLNLSRPAAV